MATSKKTKAKKTLPLLRFPNFCIGIHSGPHVASDLSGRLWRIDPGAGTARLVTIEKAKKANGRRSK